MGKGHTFFSMLVNLQIHPFHIDPIQFKICFDSSLDIFKMMIFHWLFYSLRWPFLLLEMN